MKKETNSIKFWIPLPKKQRIQKKQREKHLYRIRFPQGKSIINTQNILFAWKLGGCASSISACYFIASLQHENPASGLNEKKRINGGCEFRISMRFLTLAEVSLTELFEYPLSSMQQYDFNNRHDVPNGGKIKLVEIKYALSTYSDDNYSFSSPVTGRNYNLPRQLLYIVEAERCLNSQGLPLTSQ